MRALTENRVPWFRADASLPHPLFSCASKPQEVLRGKSLGPQLPGCKPPNMVLEPPSGKACADCEAFARKWSGRDEPGAPMTLFCPKCGGQHVDRHDGETDWAIKPHRTHLCEFCDTLWTPDNANTVGVPIRPYPSIELVNALPHYVRLIMNGVLK